MGNKEVKIRLPKIPKAKTAAQLAKAEANKATAMERLCALQAEQAVLNAARAAAGRPLGDAAARDVAEDLRAAEDREWLHGWVRDPHAGPKVRSFVGLRLGREKPARLRKSVTNFLRTQGFVPDAE